MKNGLLSLALALSLAGPVAGDEVQEARERAQALVSRSVTLAKAVAQGLEPELSRAEIFASLLKLDPHDGSSIGVYDADGHRLAWLGDPLDPQRLPEVDPSTATRFVAATRSRAALVVTEKGPASRFVLVTVPLLETRRDANDQLQVVDVLDPSRRLRLDYSDRSVETSAGAAERTISALGIDLARVRRAETAAPPAVPGSPPPSSFTVLLVGLFALSLFFAYRFTRNGLVDRRPFLIFLLCLLSAVSVASLMAEFSARSLEREAMRREAESVLRAHLRPLDQTLASAERVIDRARLFETAPAGRFGTEELAFDLWSDSELSQPFLPSFVEIIDRSGTVVSRYARDIPRGPKPALPRTSEWSRAATLLAMGDFAQAPGLVSERLLFSGREFLGAVRIGAVSDLPLAMQRLSREDGLRLVGVRSGDGSLVADPSLVVPQTEAVSGGVRFEVAVEARTYVFEMPGSALRVWKVGSRGSSY